MLNKIKFLISVITYLSCVILPLTLGFVYLRDLIDYKDSMGVIAFLALSLPIIIIIPFIISLLALATTVFRHVKFEEKIINIIKF
jgi:hypothetical protein